ncbi:protein of unknown function [Blastococcus saxobsidens DD2]|uniref:Uncharacterized protein n=1 Tax=Blastococcus saxobsidens (strain DD2) TaxID=1146883 RepID=H6RKI3_BLASD|nr:protein of unknown function [Blastococcus saxobsidens DD2]
MTLCPADACGDGSRRAALGPWDADAGRASMPWDVHATPSVPISEGTTWPQIGFRPLPDLAGGWSAGDSRDEG